MELIYKLDPEEIRNLIIIEVLAESIKDFPGKIRQIFGGTGEYKILEVLVKEGPMNKTRLSSNLFQKRYYLLSRPNPISRAFNRLLNNEIIICHQYGNRKVCGISPRWTPIIKVLFLGEMSVRVEL